MVPKNHSQIAHSFYPNYPVDDDGSHVRWKKKLDHVMMMYQKLLREQCIGSTMISPIQVTSTPSPITRVVGEPYPQLPIHLSVLVVVVTSNESSTVNWNKYGTSATVKKNVHAKNQA